jgi:hypothetical protein
MVRRRGGGGVKDGTGEADRPVRGIEAGAGPFRGRLPLVPLRADPSRRRGRRGPDL